MGNNKIQYSNDYGLTGRIKIVEISKGHLGIMKKRKSRIIMKDGHKIIESVSKLKSHDPELKISLIISGPICSKTLSYLVDNEINVIKEE